MANKEEHKVYKNKELLLEINYRCNLRCIHCSSVGVNPEYKIKLQDISKYINLAEVKSVRLSGGCPLLNLDLKDYINFFHSAGIKVILQTNGTIDLSKFTHYTEYPIDEFWISLYGYSWVHDFIVQERGSYWKTLKNIEMLRSTVLSKVVVQSPIFNETQLFSFGQVCFGHNNLPRLPIRLFALLNQGRCNFALSIEEQKRIAIKFYSKYKNYFDIELTCSLDTTKCNYENKLVLKPDGSLFNCASHKHGMKLCKK